MTSIYLISPPKIELKEFSLLLQNVLKTSLVPVFQLRLKEYREDQVRFYCRELKKICDDNDCSFIVNDYYQIAIDEDADGVHLGSGDKNISSIRKICGDDFLIGASCYDSKDLALEAKQDGANYVSFGAFFPTKTKISQGKPEPDILSWAKKDLQLPVVAIGGINDKNCDLVVVNGADFIAVISYVWENSLGEVEAVKRISDVLSKLPNTN